MYYIECPELLDITGWISNLHPNQQVEAWLRVNRLASYMVNSKTHTTHQAFHWASLEVYTTGAIMALRIHYPVKG